MSNESTPYDRPAQLSNGAKVNLRRASELWRDLQTLNLYPKERTFLMELRNRALDGSAFQGEALQVMGSLGFADSAGRVAADARDVVLSAMHGDLENVQIVSPFTHWSDRFLAEFLISADAVKGDLRPEVAERVLKAVIGDSWLRRVQAPGPDRGGFSPN